jgi:HEAT repeat protein
LTDTTYKNRASSHNDTRNAREIAELLTDHSLSSRIAAVRLLQGAGAESVHALLILAKTGAVRAAIRRVVFYLACSVSTILLLISLAAILLDNDNGAFLLTACVVFLGIAATQAPAEDEIAGALFRIDDLRAMGPIAQALDNADTRWVAEEVLIRLLPRVRASDAHVLNENQRSSLYRNLQRKNTRFVIACLEALRQIGDEAALPYVKKLAEIKGRGSTVRSIRESALETLPFLENLVQQARNKKTLLRPTGEPTDRLPRPADEPTDTLPRPLHPYYIPPRDIIRR